MSVYTKEYFSKEVSVKEYVEQYVDVETFLSYCKECPNYNRVWTCPPYDFNVSEYWKQFSVLELSAVRMRFSESVREQKLSKEQQEEILKNAVMEVKKGLTTVLLQREKHIPGSVSLSAGGCVFCEGKCTRTTGEKCRYPESMRYSLESLGANVGLTVERLLGIELEWYEEGKMPEYYVQIAGLLKK